VLTITRGMFDALVAAERVRVNVFRAVGKRGRSSRGRRQERYLKPGSVRLVEQLLDEVQPSGPVDRRRFARARFIFALGAYMGLRVSEMVGQEYQLGTGQDDRRPPYPCMSDFERLQATDREELWLFNVRHGKGNKARKVTADPRVIAALRHYRRVMGLPSLPDPRERTPLLLQIGASYDERVEKLEVELRMPILYESRVARLRFGDRPAPARDGIFSRATVRNEVRWLCDQVALWLGPERSAQAEEFARVSTHWLRHTRASEIVNEFRDLALAADELGHADLGTTRQYVHYEDTERARKLSRAKGN